MSADADQVFDRDDQWQPPETFRDCLADTERVAAMLLGTLEGQVVVPVSEVEFLARRVYQLARTAHASLPPEVS